MTPICRLTRSPVLLSLACLAAVACIDSEAVFTSLPLYEDPAPAAKGFLGYADQTSRRPFCGNCHIGQEASWRNTRHAGAWTTLQESGYAEASCEPCHTVGANGNGVSDQNVAWAATGDPRYQDVQCESCHGPGLEHITNPDASQPLPSLLVGLTATSGCGECHQGNHQPFIEEWSLSRHGNMDPEPQRDPACVQCHEARGIFSAWGIRADYLEKAGTEPISITCPVCHDPHDATNSGQLRFPIDEPNEDTNLCMKCHQRGGVPDATTTTQPHSPQGPLILGTAGWRPPNFTFADDTIVATHGTAANPRICATCHVNRLDVTDLLTGELIFNATGHLFQATPCLDAEGRPTTDPDCEPTERSYAACAASGCHANEQVARSALTVARGRLETRLATLNGLLAQIPVAEFDSTDNRLTTAEGARFNAELGALRGSPVHNPFLIEALMDASIAEVLADYPQVTPTPSSGGAVPR